MTLVKPTDWNNPPRFGDDANRSIVLGEFTGRG
jgi:hypothetical protein